MPRRLPDIFGGRRLASALEYVETENALVSVDSKPRQGTRVVTAVFFSSVWSKAYEKVGRLTGRSSDFITKPLLSNFNARRNRM